VDEIQYFNKLYGVKEFHIEDLNPTVDKKRMINISKLIMKRKLKITWKIGSGTKLETLDKEALTWMSKAGCTYISISPESGSPRLLKTMNKSFNHQLGLDLVEYMSKLGITTQACFVLGFPGETKKDLELTEDYLCQLVKKGISEIALFIITPAPGSSIYNPKSKKYKSLSQLTFSPKWRKDYEFYHKTRKSMYAKFFLLKLRYRPLSLLKLLINFLTGRFSTKMEMTLYRYLRLKYFLLKN
jgi:radical SAM superfamily enzyme YgiQ (UPF0313 family)